MAKKELTLENEGELYVAVMKLVEENFIIDKDDRSIRELVTDTFNGISSDLLRKSYCVTCGNEVGHEDKVVVVKDGVQIGYYHKACVKKG